MSSPGRTPRVYRHRKVLFAAVYIGGFTLGAALDAALRRGKPVAAYRALGQALPALGARGLLGIGCAATCAGFGLRVWGSAYLRAETVWSDDLRTGDLHVDGPFRFTRNPLYLGTLALAAGVGLLATLPGLGLVVAGNLALCAALARGEEGSLRAAFGKRYDAYARRVPRFIPTLKPAPAGTARPDLAAGLATETATSGIVLALLAAFVTQRPRSAAVWIALGSGPLVAVAVRHFCRRQ